MPPAGEERLGVLEDSVEMGSGAPLTSVCLIVHRGGTADVAGMVAVVVTVAVGPAAPQLACCGSPPG